VNNTVLGLDGAAAGLPPAATWAFTALLGAFALWSFFGAFRALRRARLVEDVPTSLVRSAAQGYVELAGTAELLPGEPVLAPLSGRPCAWYRYRVDERSRDASNGRREWKTLEGGVSDALFRLVDESGECVVDPDHAEVTPGIRQVWYGVARRPGGPPPPGSGFSLFGGRYRYREELIRPGDPLHAVGMLRTVGGPTDPVPAREDVRALLAAWKRDPPRMQGFDANGDGQVDPAEWDAARRAAESEVRRRRTERAASPGVTVLAAPPAAGGPFLLSAVRQDDLARRYRRTALARLVLFFGAGAAAVLMSGLAATG
jgi:hypothetical protein